MLAAVMTEIGQPLAVREIPDPVAGPGEVLLRVDACGICGSDLHASEHLALPGLVLGHEFCATVAETGPGVSAWVPGDRVVAMSLATCGQCVDCLAGKPRKCPAAQMVGIESPGAYAQYVVMAAHALIAMPDSLDHRHGALVEPLAVALHALERGRVGIGEDVVVLGAGPVGQAVVLWLDRLGAREIIVSDPSPSRRATAETLGATLTLDPSATDIAAEAAERCRNGVTHVIECVGIPGLLQQATEVAGVDGSVTIAGVCMAQESVLPLVAMSKELDIRFAFYYRHRDMVTTIDLMAAGRLDPLPLVTSEISLHDVPQRFEQLKQPGSDSKVLIRP